MADTDFDLSTDGGNNNENYFFHRCEPDNIESLPFDADHFLGSETNLIHRKDSSSSDSEALLNNSIVNLDFPDNTSFHRLFKQRQVKKIKIIPSKSNYWCLPKELYKREIGQFEIGAQWRYKFYQSAVAVHKLKLSKLLRGNEGCANSLDFNKTGDIIASGSDDFRICLWDWSNGKCLLNYSSLHTGNISQTKFLTTHGDSHIVSSGQDGLVVLSDVKNNCDIINSEIIAHHDRSCNKVGVHYGTPFVVLSCGDDGIVKNIDIRKPPINENERITNILHIKNAHGTAMHLYSIDINPVKPYEFIVNGNDEYVRMYDKRHLTTDPVKVFRREHKNTKTIKTDNIAMIRTDDSAINNTDNYSDVYGTDRGDVDVPRPRYSREITSAVYSYCGTEILAAYSEDDIYLFDAYGRSNSVLHNYGGHINGLGICVKGVNFYGPRSDYVVSGLDCGFMLIWDKKTEAILQKKCADIDGTVSVLEAHPHMPTLATSGLDKIIKIWEP